MPMQLVVMTGLERGRVLPLQDADILQLGCSQHLDLQARFRDPMVARVHCEIHVRGDQVIIQDAETPNGTFVNGKRIRREILQPGDIIRMGNTQLRFQAVVQGPHRPLSTLMPTVTVSHPNPAEETPVRAVLPKKQATERAKTSLNLVGRTLGHYVVELHVGTGYWGRVYRARDTRVDHRVAIKILRPEFGRLPDCQALLARALKTLLRIHHVHLITYLGAGKAGSLYWLAMEYVEAKTLTSRIRRISGGGKLDWRGPFGIAVQLARALEAIHEHGEIHGLVTPTNVLLREGDERVKLTDLLLGWTLARISGLADPDQDYGAEQLGYLAPEQLVDANSADERSDIYSLGATIYAMLTGQAPFSGATPDEVLDEIESHVLPRPRKFQPGLPHLFENVVLRMLARCPEDRFQSMSEVLANLYHVGRCSQVPIDGFPSNLDSDSTNGQSA